MAFLDRFRGLDLGGIALSGGPGDALQTAIVIHGAPNTQAGIRTEYLCLEALFGRRGVDWQLERQALLVSGDRRYDEMRLRLADGTSKTVYFDITDFFGKV